MTKEQHGMCNLEMNTVNNLHSDMPCYWIASVPIWQTFTDKSGCQTKGLPLAFLKSPQM